MVIDAFYSFKLEVKSPSLSNYSIKRLCKAGNNEIFNAIFSNSDEIEIVKYGPIKDLSDYIGYATKDLNKISDYRPILFGTSVLAEGYGLVKTEGKEDAILFLMLEESIFEVYIFKGKYSSSILLLQMLKDGALNNLVESVKAKILK